MIQPISMQALTLKTNNSGIPPVESYQNFGSYLESALDSVRQQEEQAKVLQNDYMLGKADVTDVMMATTNAQLSLQLTAQVRNKVVEAYQEVMRMQL